MGPVGKLKGAHTVYIGIDKYGIARYVGRTTREVATRGKEHLAEGGRKAGLLFDEVAGGVRSGVKEARILEQKLINQYGGPAKQLVNKINSVAKKYWDELGID